MIAIVDYGVGNLFSLSSSVQSLGAEVRVTGKAEDLRTASHILLPGVGAFADAMAKLEATGLVPVLKEEVQRKPLLGICLGMQLLFEKSYEYGEHKGLGIVKGEVRPLRERISGLKIPHMGWNKLRFTKYSEIFEGLKDGDYVYFVHSYYGKCADDSMIASTDYGFDVTAAVQRGNVFGVQFHPEKSGDVGLKILNNFVNL